MNTIKLNKKMFIALLACLTLLFCNACSFSEKDKHAESINSIQVMFSDEKKDGPIKNGDVINVKVVTTIDGKVIATGDANQKLKVGSDTIEPDIDKMIIGAQKGDDFTSSVDFKDEDGQDKTRITTATITNVFYLRKADDELAKLFAAYEAKQGDTNAAKVKTMDDLRKFLDGYIFD